VVTTIFGGLLGISVSEETSAASLITSVNKAITDLVRATNPEIAGLEAVVWIFVIVMAVFCFPAFWRDK